MYISKRIEDIANHENKLAISKIEAKTNELLDRLSFRVSYENPQGVTDKHPVFSAFLLMGFTVFMVFLWGIKFSVPIELLIILSIASIIVFASIGIVVFSQKKEIKKFSIEDDLKELLSTMCGYTVDCSIVSTDDQIELKVFDKNLGFVWKKMRGLIF